MQFDLELRKAFGRVLGEQPEQCRADHPTEQTWDQLRTKCLGHRPCRRNGRQHRGCKTDSMCQCNPSKHSDSEQHRTLSRAGSCAAQSGMGSGRPATSMGRTNKRL